jgi:hypothetical protein
MINGQESPEIIVKRTNELYDYIVDWEYSILVPTARTQTILFDKIDIIYLAGDTKIMPWEPSCFDLIILLHIFHLMNKPVLSLGGGAFAAIYASATQGVRFHMINGKIGGSLEQLPYQTTYFKGSNAVRCGWLENETGDVYSFDRSSTSWVPTFNTGIYRYTSLHTSLFYITLTNPQFNNLSMDIYVVEMRLLVLQLQVDLDPPQRSSPGMIHSA